MIAHRGTLRSLGDRIGGPNSVTWPGFIITLVLALSLNLVTVGLNSGEAFRRGLVALVVGQCAAYALLVVARGTVLRGARIRPMPVRTVITFAIASLIGGIAAGIVTATATGTDPPPQSPPDPATAIVALSGTLVSATVVLAVSALIVDTWREHRANVIRVMALEARIAHSRQARSHVADEAADAVRDQLTVAIAERLSTLETLDSARMADALNTVVDDVIRPMSRALFVPSQAPQELLHRHVRTDYRVSVRDATNPPLLLAGWMAILIGMLVFFATALSQGLVGALQITGVTILTIILICLVANAVFVRIMNTLTVTGRLIALIVSIVILTLALVVVWVTLTPLDGNQLQLWALASVVVTIAMMLTGAKLGSAITARQQHEIFDLEELAHWEEARSRLVHWEASSALAEALHGPVQSSLLAAALRLEAAATADGSIHGWTDARTVIDAAIEAFTRGIGNDSDVGTTLTSLQRTWSPLCDVRWHIDQTTFDRLSHDAIGARAVSAILIEACSNAVRHARAERVHVTVASATPGHLSIVVEDSGTSEPNSDNPPGGGSALLDAVCLTWSRSRNSEGSTLTAVVPIASQG